MTLTSPERLANSMSDAIAAQVRAVRNEIATAAHGVGRDPASVTLVAVTKTQGPEVLASLREAGVRDFAENRIEHLHEMLPHGQPGDRWHYLGRVQGRQLAKLAPHIDVLHSLCELDHVQRLSRACAVSGRRIQVYAQVNVSGEAAKAGVTREALPALLAAIRQEPAFDLRGLMTMAPDLHPHGDPATAARCFAELRVLAEQHGLPGLSMGMSGDFALAVAEGATVVRIGSRLFA